jgi:AraC-like DNA-binding protein
MAITIPLIRGFALLPALHWLTSHGIETDAELARAGLPADLVSHPFRPVPLVQVAALLRTAADQIAPDLPCRIVADAATLEIAMLGKVALGSGTPREALRRIIEALPYYCSHEQISMERKAGATVVREFFSHRFDPTTSHYLLQYASAMIDRICAMTAVQGPRLARIELPPHPLHGVEHLRRWFGRGLSAARTRGFAIVIDDGVMDHPFTRRARSRVDGRNMLFEAPLRGDGTLSGSVRTLLMTSFGGDQVPSLDRVVAAAGTSKRSFQRQLEAEGATYSDLLAEVRRSETLSRLTRTDRTIATIASELGYGDQASLTRAFRRWTGRPPSRFRTAAS